MIKVYWVTTKIGEKIANVGRMNLFLKEVILVEEDDDRDATEAPVVDNGLEDIQRLNQSVCHPVLQDCLVVSAGGHKEEHCSHIIETVKPFLPLRSLASDINESKLDTLNWHNILVNASSRFPRMQDIFTTGNIVL